MSDMSDKCLINVRYLAGYTPDISGFSGMWPGCRSRSLPGAYGFQTIIRRTLAPSLAPQPESQPESLETRVLRLLEDEPKSKAELSRGLGQKEISGQLNKVVRKLLADRMIEYTIPEKPQSRHQKYRLTGQGRAALAKGPGGDAL
jgi:hypothetical protein